MHYGDSSAVENLVNQKGVAVHTAAMLRCEREASEIAFDSGRALALIATGTLSQGLNLSAKAVVICGTKLAEYGDQINTNPKELQRRSLTQVLNAVRQAARANVDCRGISIVVPDVLIRGLTKNTAKSEFVRTINVLALRDASLSTDSAIRSRLESVGTEGR